MHNMIVYNIIGLLYLKKHFTIYMCTLLACISHYATQGQRICPGESIERNGICYKFFKQPMTWFDADFHCQTLGGSLPSIHDYSTNIFILDYRNKNNKNQFLNTIDSSKLGVWIGLNDISIEQDFKWSDGSQKNYINWSDNEPNNVTVSEDCIEMYNTGRWNDLNCNLLRRYTCSIKKDTPDFRPHVTTTIAPGCYRADWLLHAGNCYFFSNDLKSWSDAKTDCLSKAGDLVKATTIEENNFLLKQLSKRTYVFAWTGYRNITHSSKEWTDGGEIKYWNNNQGYDNDHLPCIKMTSIWESLYKSSCSKKLNYICKSVNTYQAIDHTVYDKAHYLDRL